jgi:hypothetical protein
LGPLLAIAQDSKLICNRAKARLALLTPLPFAPFLLLWSIASICNAMRHNFGLLKPPPRWMTSWPMEILGSCFWVPAALVAMVILYVRSARKLDALFAGQCRHCGYDLAGIATICPECGHTVARA